MEGFKVNTGYLNNIVSANLNDYENIIEKLENEVDLVSKNLRNKIAVEGEIKRRLRIINKHLLDEAAAMSSLREALSHIAGYYKNAERKIVIRGMTPFSGGQDVTAEQQAMMDQQMQSAIYSALQEDERFSEAAWKNASNEERKEILNDLLLRIESEMGISIGDVEYRNDLPADQLGSYLYDKNRIVINENLLSEKDSYKEMTTVLMHESRHAYQHAVCENPDQFIVSKENINKWEDSAANYHEYMKQGDYFSIVSEVDARNFAGQEQRIGEKVYFASGKNGNDREMYSKRAFVAEGSIYTVEGNYKSSTIGYGQEIKATDMLILEYNLKPVGKRAGLFYQEYKGYVIEKDGDYYPGYDYSEISGSYMPKEGAVLKTFYIGDGPTTEGVVKIDRGYGGAWTAETLNVIKDPEKERVKIIDNSSLCTVPHNKNNNSGNWALNAVNDIRALDNKIKSDTLADAKKVGMGYALLGEVFLNTVNPVGSICDIAEGVIDGNYEIYMNGVINMGLTSTNSDYVNYGYGALQTITN